MTAALCSWLQAQRRAVGAHAVAEGHAAEADTTDAHRALREACEEARRRGAHVEQLIVLLKQMWAALPPNEDGDGRGTGWRGGRRNGRLDGEREALERVIRLCIDEFYAPPRPTAGQPERRHG